MLNVGRLRVLKEVAYRGSFSGAAEALSYSQSAVSQQIAALEAETGLTLLERHPRGVSLTAAGQALLRHAEDIVPRLRAGELDLALLFEFPGQSLPTQGMTRAGLLADPMYLALPRDHALAERGRIRLQDLDGEAWVQT